MKVLTIKAATIPLSGEIEMDDVLREAFRGKTVRAGNYHLARQAIGHGLIRTVADIKTMWTPHSKAKEESL